MRNRFEVIQKCGMWYVYAIALDGTTCVPIAEYELEFEAVTLKTALCRTYSDYA